jgi:hypothetical protein
VPSDESLGYSHGVPPGRRRPLLFALETLGKLNGFLLAFGRAIV